MSDQPSPSAKGAFSLREFLEWSSIGRTKALTEIYGGRLRAVKAGKKLLIPTDAAAEWLKSQPAVSVSPRSGVSAKA
ncbi:MAG: DNA-binding protein [Mesorhizobium sp.]|uniref:hypothetical protein n=1 Tax=Mesorhizobium sp. TaxID=1871066 RepID=UPI000FE7E390|nr:hypothetical protein [Mesorhizobium sp.]RWB44801.1 MAG: DNA-binding protein [Mesorhizobium sp.]